MDDILISLMLSVLATIEDMDLQEDIDVMRYLWTITPWVAVDAKTFPLCMDPCVNPTAKEYPTGLAR